MDNEDSLIRFSRSILLIYASIEQTLIDELLIVQLVC